MRYAEWGLLHWAPVKAEHEDGEKTKAPHGAYLRKEPFKSSHLQPKKGQLRVDFGPRAAAAYLAAFSVRRLNAQTLLRCVQDGLQHV